MAIYSGFTDPLKMVISHRYVSLPEGNGDLMGIAWNLGRSTGSILATTFHLLLSTVKFVRKTSFLVVHPTNPE